MLSSIHIENIAIMDNVNIDFEKGFCVLTGETGAGKSIIIDSVNLLTGERSSRELVRSGCDRAVVEGAVYTDDKNVYKVLEENGISFEKGEPIVLCREINKDGRSTVRINGRISTTGLLKSICARIISIHGQNDNQLILDTSYHGKLLDSFAEDEKELSEYKAIFEKVEEIEKKLSKQESDGQLKEQKIDILTYQINEIETAKIHIGEYDEICSMREKYLNNEKITRLINECYAFLNGDENTAGGTELIQNAAHALTELSAYDSSLSECSEKLNDLVYQLSDISAEISASMEYDVDEIDIDSIESRIDVLSRLKKKYGSSEEEILSLLDKLKAELDELNNREVHNEQLKKELDTLKKELKECASRLTKKRKKGALTLEKEVIRQLSDLEMDKAIFKVSFTPCDCFKYGAEKTEFMISANKGQEVKPLSKIASGGELSRIILALKVILAGNDSISTMIFDEVDTGVSGSTAQKIAEKIKTVSKDKQVFVITHLAQIAAFADCHYLVAKKTENNKTTSTVTLLSHEQRVNELARIISGSVITQNALNTAEEMLVTGNGQN